MLVAIRPFHGHLNPVVPIARALCAAGHEVRLATERRFGAVVERSGFASLPAGLDPFALPEWASHEFSAATTRHKLGDILGLARAWPFELILRDPTDFAALIAAEALDVPQATIGFARYIPPAWWRRELGSSLDRVRREVGLPADPGFERLHPGPYVDLVPPWLQADDTPLPRTLYRVRAEPYQTPAASASPIAIEPSRKPLVLVTLGTVFNRQPQLLSRLCRGAAETGANVICTLGPQVTASELDLVPSEGVRLSDFVALAQVLPRCALVICHGGYNTVVASVLQGVPLLIVPLGADNDFNARRCSELGVGIRVPPELVTEQHIAELVTRLVGDRGYRDRAQKLAAEIMTLPPLATAVPLLEQLTRPTSDPPVRRVAAAQAGR